MISKKKRKYILEKTKKLNKQITEVYEDYFEKLSKILIKYYNTEDTEKNFDKLSEKLQDKILDMLGKVYSITSAELKIIYNINKKKKLPKSEIKTFSQDGYNLQERLNRWFNQSSKDFIQDKIQAISQLREILITECLYQKQVVMNDKLKGFCEFGIIEESPDCHSGICNEYAGEWPINELIYPPYHPNCQCEVIYEISDDIEDVKDLDLEDDLDEEYYE